MNADKPLVKFENIGKDLALSFGDEATVRGSVMDDDSSEERVVQEFIISSSSVTSSDGFTLGEANDELLGDNCKTWSRSVTLSSGGTGTEVTTFNPKTGKWKYKPADINDGRKDVYIYVKDNNDNLFYTANAKSLYLPRVQFNDQNENAPEVKTIARDKITYSSDSEVPSVYKFEIRFAGEDKVYSNWESFSTSTFGGKVKRYIKFRVTSKDTSGIKDMNFKIGNTSVDFETTDSQDRDHGGEDSVWITNEIDLRGNDPQNPNFASGPLEVSATPIDNFNMKGSYKVTIFCDNEIPADEFRPTRLVGKQNGTVVLKGYATDGSGAGIKANSIKWAVPKRTQDPATVSESDLTWQGTSASDLPAWEFIFDGTNNPSFSDFMTSEYVDVGASNVDSFTIPVLFRVEDELGNYLIHRTFSFEYQPDADIPTTEIDYPTSALKANNELDIDNPTKVGRNIRITGTATGNIEINKVYLQLAVTTTPVEPSAWIYNEATLTSLLVSDELEITTLSQSKIQNFKGKGATTGVTDFEATGHFFNVDTDWWGIEANGKRTWNLAVNKNQRLVDQYLWIRACSVVDEDNDLYNEKLLCGAWSKPQMVKIDSDTPIVGAHTFQLGFYNKATNVFTPYTDLNSDTNSYISNNNGELWLAVSAEDNNGIRQAAVQKTVAGNQTVSLELEDFVTVKNHFSDDKAAWPTQRNNMMIYIPLDMSVDGRLTYTIEATEDVDDQKTGNISRTFDVDNTAPLIKNVIGGNIPLESPTEEYKIRDSNYIFNVSGEVEEGGAGFERLLFYFYRGSELGVSADKQVYLDPIFMDNTWTKTNDSKLYLSTLDKIEIAQSGNTFTVYGKNIAGKQLGSDPEEFVPTTPSDITGNKHIKVGSLILIGGKLRRIEAINSTTGVVRFKGSTGVTSDTNCTASFIYGQVIDYIYDEVTTNAKTDVFEFASGKDDGDGMPEKITMLTSGSSWSADIHTKNIPDGPATLVLLAFDKAGNISSKTFKTTISNNAPRITRLYIGTDLDSSGTFIKEEFEEYNFLGVEGKNIEEIELETKDYDKAVQDKQGNWEPVKHTRSSFKIKDKLAIAPEFVGGNGEIKVVFNKNSTTETKVEGTGAALISPVATGNPFDSAVKMYLFENSEFDTIQGTKKAMSFTFWDSTDELIMGRTTQYAFLRVNDFTVSTTDITKPNVVVNKFLWKSSSVNSLYGNKKDNGHIELEGDLPSGLTGYTAGLPKVSGKIVVRGTAFDDTALANIRVTFGNIQDELAAEFQNDGEWETYGDLETDGWNFKVYDHHYNVATCTKSKLTMAIAKNYYGVLENKTEEEAIRETTFFGQDGHKIAWELVIDTEKALGTGNVAGLNKELKIVAIDHNNQSSEDRPLSETPATDENMHRPTYKMDVVPYVTKVWTPLAKEDKSNWSVYNRSALGHYPVAVKKAGGGATAEADKIYLYGFNLSGGSLSDESSNSITLTLEQNTNDSNKQAYAAALPTDIQSGKMTVTVNGVQSINNLNNNDASGFDVDGLPNIADISLADYENLSAYCYNRQPNNSNNNKLTDDVILDVWDLNTKAGTTVYNGAIGQPVMSINPVEKNIGFAYQNGSMTFSMGGKHNNTPYSTKYWIGGTDGWTSIGFTYDALGHSYGVSASGDIDGANGGMDRYRIFTDRWGVGQYSASGYTGRYNSNRLELIGQLRTDGDTVHPNMERERIQSSSLATTVSGDNTNVYLAYYDLINNEIRFKWGTFEDDHTQENTGKADANIIMGERGNAKNVGLFVDEYGPGSETVSNSAYEAPNKKAQYYRINHINLIAGTSTEASVGKDTTANYSTGYDAGEFVDIAAIKQGDKDVVVAVWWDAANKRLMYSYIEDPMRQDSTNRETKIERIESDNAATLDYYIKKINDANNSAEAYFYYGEDIPAHRITIAKGADGYYYSTDANGGTRPLFAYGDHAGAYVYATGANNTTLYYLDALSDGKDAYFPEVKLPDGYTPAEGGTNNTTPGTDEASGNAKDGSILYKDNNSWDALKVRVASTSNGTPFYGINLDSNGNEVGTQFPLYIQNGSSYEEAKVTSSSVKNLLYYKESDGTYKRLWRVQLQGSLGKYKGYNYDNSKFMTPIYARVYTGQEGYAYEGGYKYTSDQYDRTRNGWATPIELASGGIGEYCKVVVDGNDGIHVAAYDNVNTNVVYFYSPSYDSPFTKYVVDSQGNVGEEIGLDVAIENGNAIPYITYYSKNCSRPKIAYLVNNADGADSDDRYTGAWEISIVPTSSNVPKDNNHNNIGLWKDSSGRRISSVKKDGTIGTSVINANDNNSCVIYGNGTDNAVIGYATKTGGQGCIETAQMR